MFSLAMGAARPVDVTEYHVLRSQRNAANDGGRCELSEMRDAGLAQIGIFCKNMCFPYAGTTFCRRIKKNDKIGGRNSND